MSKELDYFFDLNINCDEASQAEELENLLEDNGELVADWDLQGVDDDGSPLDGAIFGIQFDNLLQLTTFITLLEENGFKL